MDFGIVYQEISNNKNVTLRKLKEAGIDVDKISELEAAKILKASSNGTDTYEICDVDKLFAYGKDLLSKSDFHNANSIFDTCYSIDPNHFLVNFQLFYRDLVRQGDDKELFKHFDIVYRNLKGDGRESDANFYLLLVGYLRELPDKYKEVFINLEEKDILLREESDKTRLENKMRSLIINNSYYDANTAMQERFSSYNNNSFEDQLERELLIKIMKKNRDINNMIYRYIIDDRIKELKDLLDSEDEKRFLSRTNQYLLRVINQYLTIQDTMVIPDVTKVIDTNVFEAIKGNDFRGALKAADAFNQKLNMARESTMQMMLRKINLLIDDVNEYYLHNPDKKPTKVVEEDPKKVEYKNSLSDEEISLLDSYIEELVKGKPATLLEPMSLEKRDAIRRYIKSKKDVVSFEIGQDDERRVVLRYKPHVDFYVNIMDTVREAKRCLNKTKQYEKAKEKYELILKLGVPRDITYAEYGLTLAKLGKNKEAIEFLEIATILSKDNKGNLDYTDLIYELLNGVTAEKKPQVKVDVKEFEEEKKINFDMSFLPDLISLVHEGDIKLADACKKLNLSDLEINYVKLLYARDCYYLRDFAEGDLYYYQVEKSKTKNKEIVKLMEDLRLSKKFYWNRLDEDRKQLVFKQR